MQKVKRPPAGSRFMAFVFGLSGRVPAPDFDVRATLPDAQERTVIGERLGRALSLLRLYAPVRYEALLRDLPRILVGPSDGLGECHDAVGLCLLKFDYVVADETTPEELALTLVHEGMHARLTRAGFTYGEAQRARIERACLRAELAVAERLPGGDTAANRARRLMAWSDNMWTDAAIRERQQHRLEELGWAGKAGAWIGRAVTRWRLRGGPGAA